MGKIIHNGITYSGTADVASNIIYNNSISELSATNVQEAIDYLAANGGGGGSVKTLINITTTVEELFNKQITILCPDGSTKVATFSSDGHAQINVDFVGDYVVTCGNISGIINVAAIGSITNFELLDNFKELLKRARLSKDAYSSLDELLEDEKALRQILTIHDSVDYLVTWLSNDEDSAYKILENDLVAKWVNLRDYTLDKLSENEAIKAVMDKTVVVHDVAQVPLLSDYTGTNGVVTYSGDRASVSAQAWKAFNSYTDNNRWEAGETRATSFSNLWVAYEFINPVEVKKFSLQFKASTNVSQFKLQAYDETISAWKDLTEILTTTGVNVIHYFDITKNKGYYKNYKLLIISQTLTSSNTGGNVNTLQFYADEYDTKYGYGEWALIPQVPIMTSNTTPYGEAFADSTTNAASHDYYKAFDGITNTAWLSNNNIANLNLGVYIGYKFNKSVKINAIKIKLQSESSKATIKLQGSDDKSTWTDIDNSFDIITGENYKEIKNSSVYVYYRILFISQTGTSTTIQAGRIEDLQFYAWQPKGNVPIMTANDAPYGECLSNDTTVRDKYKAFDNNSSTYWSPASGKAPANIGYRFTNPCNIKMVSILPYLDSGNQEVKNFEVRGSNTGNEGDWETIYTGVCENLQTETAQYFKFENDKYYLCYDIYITSTYRDNNLNLKELQFYGRELKVSVPKMTGNTDPWGEAFGDSIYGADYDFFKAFDKNSDISAGRWVSSKTSAPIYIGYDFKKNVVIKGAYLKTVSETSGIFNSSWDVEVSNDATWSQKKKIGSISVANKANAESLVFFDNSEPFTKCRFNWLSGRNDAVEVQFYGLDYSEREFEPDGSVKFIYDHGVEVENIKSKTVGNGIAIKQNDKLYFETPDNSAKAYHLTERKIDISPYNLLRSHFSNIGKLKTGSTSNQMFWFVLSPTEIETDYVEFKWNSKEDVPYTYSLDVASQKSENYILCGLGSSNAYTYGSISEIWLEK